MLSSHFTVFKGVFKAGLISWVHDKKSLINRLVLLPLSLPFFFLILFVAVALAVNTRGNTTNEAGETISATTVALVSGQYDDAVTAVLSKGSSSYDILLVSKDEIELVVASGKATFGLSVEPDLDGLSFELFYDLDRNYVHKTWLRDIRYKRHDIKRIVDLEKLELLGAQEAVFNIISSTSSFNVSTFGDKGGVSMLLGIMILLWNVMIVAPIDYAKTTLYRLFVEDVQNDILPCWKSAKVPPFLMLSGRLAASVFVFSVTSIIMLLHVFVWGGGYYLLVDYIISSTDMLKSADQSFILITVGFKDFVDSQSLAGIFVIVLSTIFTATLILTYFIPSTLKSVDSEQARNRNKLFDFALMNVPIIGFLVGFQGLNYYLLMIPVFNQYHLSASIMSTGVDWFALSILALVSIALIVAILYRSKKLIESDTRYLSVT